jgi:carboxymethylenebutenolidase
MNEMQNYLVEEMIEEYQAGRITRRELFRRATLITGSAVLASTALAVVPTAPVLAAPAPRATPQTGVTVSPDDADITAGPASIPGDGVALIAYLSRPRAEGVYPGVLVIHENRGLTDNQRDITRRLAKAGYVGLAIDLLSRQGGNAGFADEGAAIGAYGQLPPEQMLGDLVTSLSYLRALPYVRADSTAAMGFCAGGAHTWRLATLDPNLRAAAPFYGSNPSLDAVPNIQAAVLAFYGGEDARLNAGIPDIERAMRDAGKTFEYVVYPGAQHAFFNDTRPEVYHPEAASDAWTRLLDWFGRYLGGGGM